MPGPSTRPATAFAPAHVTGFFFLPPELQGSLGELGSWNPGSSGFHQLMTRAGEARTLGSVGAGLSLDMGMTTSVELSGKRGSGEEPTVRCVYNLKAHPLEELKITGFVTRALLASGRGLLAEPETPGTILLRMESPLPLKAGFGMSGAAALSVGFALNEVLELGLSRKELGSLAHLADCWNRGGLGDVAGQLLGGFEHRKEPGLDGIVKLPLDAPGPEIFILSSSEALETRAVLSNPEKMAAVRAAGEKANKLFSDGPILENFFSVSYRFSKEAGLIPPGFKALLEELNKTKGCQAAPAHLGNTVLAVGDGDSILGLFRGRGRVFRSRIAFGGAGLLL